jgi:hypothetical protein
VRLSLLIACLMAIPTVASTRPADPAAQPRFLHERAPAAVDAAAFEREEADTFFLFAASGPGSFGSPGTDARGYTFDGSGGMEEPAGWFGVDATRPPQAWHLDEVALCAGGATDMSSALPFFGGDPTNDHALWCGLTWKCAWQHNTGYGNNWDCSVILSAGAWSDSLELNMIAAWDFEGGAYDYLELLLEVDGEPELVATFDDEDPRAAAPLQLVLRAADYSGAVGDLHLRFLSDGGWSDEDGQHETEIGAVWLDNIVLRADAVEVLRTDFESGILPAGIEFSHPEGAGLDAALYANLFSEDICVVNSSNAWAFMGCSSWPFSVICYGPPYHEQYAQSPRLERMHQAGSPTGEALIVEPGDEFRLEYQVYMDNPLNALIFHLSEIDWYSHEIEDCWRSGFSEQTLYYGEEKRWLQFDYHILPEIPHSSVAGLDLRLGMIDMCAIWCNTNGDGTGHRWAPYIDNVRMKLIRGGSQIDYGHAEVDRFQDAFRDAGSGLARMDMVRNIGGEGFALAGDSALVTADFTNIGGLAEVYSGEVGEMRPALELWWRVTDGPHASSNDPAMADPDAVDGIWSPWTGTTEFDGDTWNRMLADSASWGGVIAPNRFAFDFNDAHFQGGDRLDLFFRAETTDGSVHTLPATAQSAIPGEREFHELRILPDPDSSLLLVLDGAPAVSEWKWRSALAYNGYHEYDLYRVGDPGGNHFNSPGGRAQVEDLAGYGAVIWDCGAEPSHTLSVDPRGNDQALLESYLSSSEEPLGLWLLGNWIAMDLGQGHPFLNEVLGAERSITPGDLFDFTDLLVPRVEVVHPDLEFGGETPWFWLAEELCQDQGHYDPVHPIAALAETAMDWEDWIGVILVAGVLNRDPDGDGGPLGPLGAANPVLYNPFGYHAVRDGGFGVPYGFDYSRRLVGNVLEDLFGHEPGSSVGSPDPSAARATRLVGAWPNPFNPSTAIRFDLAADGPVRLRVYDLSGRRLRTLVDETRQAGHHELVWDGRDGSGRELPSGVYFLRMQADGKEEATRLVLLK